MATAIFEVAAKGYPNVSFQWYQVNDFEPENPIPMEFGNTRILTLLGVSSDMNGRQYFCRVSNDVDSVDSDPATLTVLYPPTITVDPITQEVPEEGTLVLSIEYTEGNPAETTFVWKKDGAVLNDGGRVSGATTAELTITDFIDTYEGDYTCTVSNTSGEDVSTVAVITMTAPLNPFDPSYWVCSNGYSFDLEDGITQLFNDVGDAYAVRYISNVAGLVVAYTCNWSDGGTVSSSGAVCYNGIGMKPIASSTPQCAYPAGIDGIGAYGAWQLRTSGCFSNKTVQFIGRNNDFSEYYSGCILDTGVNHVTNILMTVSEDKGGNMYDIEIHLIVDGTAIDVTRTIEDIHFPNGDGQFMIGGLQCGTDPGGISDGWSQHINQLDILES